MLEFVQICRLYTFLIALLFNASYDKNKKSKKNFLITFITVHLDLN